MRQTSTRLESDYNIIFTLTPLERLNAIGCGDAVYDAHTLYLNHHGYPAYRRGQTEILVHRNVARKRYVGWPPSWHVHHINEDKTDWRSDNLIPLPPEVHDAIHDHYRHRSHTARAAARNERTHRDNREAFTKGIRTGIRRAHTWWNTTLRRQLPGALTALNTAKRRGSL